MTLCLINILFLLHTLYSLHMVNICIICWHSCNTSSLYCSYTWSLSSEPSFEPSVVPWSKTAHMICWSFPVYLGRMPGLYQYFTTSFQTTSGFSYSGFNLWWCLTSIEMPGLQMQIYRALQGSKTWAHLLGNMIKLLSQWPCGLCMLKASSYWPVLMPRMKKKCLKLKCVPQWKTISNK